MQLIVHYTLSTAASHLIFNQGRRMLYCLDEEMYISGVGYYYHYFLDDAKDRSFEFKLKFMIDQADENRKAAYQEFYENYKFFLKSKNKDSKWIIQTNILKRDFEKLFDLTMQDFGFKLETTHGTSTFRELHDCKKVVFYGVDDPNITGKRDATIPLEEILSLKIADEDDIPILFLGNEDYQGKQLFDTEIKDILAKDHTKGYLVDVFQFPYLQDVQAAELKAITYEFSKEIEPIKEDLKKWATLALKSSNPEEAQQFFIKNLVPIIENKRRSVFQINAAKDICSKHYPNYTFHLQFGELPVDKIWEYYKTYNQVTEEEFEKLLKLKEQNPTKFNRRWPVVFFKTDNKAIYNKHERQDEQPKTRKTLDI